MNIDKIINTIEQYLPEYETGTRLSFRLDNDNKFWLSRNLSDVEFCNIQQRASSPAILEMNWIPRGVDVRHCIRKFLDLADKQGLVLSAGCRGHTDGSSSHPTYIPGFPYLWIELIPDSDSFDCCSIGFIRVHASTYAPGFLHDVDESGFDRLQYLG